MGIRMSSTQRAARAHVITVAGAKGGVGKTTTCINLAASLVDAGFETAVLDLDLAMANLLDFLDLPLDASSDPTAHEVLAGEADLAEATYPAPGGMDVIPAGPSLEGYARADLDRLDDLLEELEERYEFLVLDTGAGVSPDNTQPLAAADEVVVVSTPRVASVRDAEKTIQLVERVGSRVHGLLLTKSGTGYAPGPDRIGDFLDVPVLAHVPEDVAIPRSQDAGVPVVANEPETEASEAYRTLATALLWGPAEGATTPGEAADDLSDLRRLLWSKPAGAATKGDISDMDEQTPASPADPETADPEETEPRTSAEAEDLAVNGQEPLTPPEGGPAGPNVGGTARPTDADASAPDEQEPVMPTDADSAGLDDTEPLKPAGGDASDRQERETVPQADRGMAEGAVLSSTASSRENGDRTTDRNEVKTESQPESADPAGTGTSSEPDGDREGAVSDGDEGDGSSEQDAKTVLDRLWGVLRRK
jgi:septum site-determining protein MinD